ncbi:MAG: T9SS type A sorting domain-containing protein, partial [Ignavibacteria bacterium]|nr:T9SS type A sorting domain-containing protein [Ignavibacteria bacterium]
AGFRVVDISNPFQPVVVDSVHRINEEAVRVAVKNDTAYVSWNSDGIRLYDVSDPTKIVEIDYYITSDPEQIRFDNEYVYLADDEAGIYIFQNDGVSSIDEPNQDKLPQDFYLEQNYPNPFNPTTQIEFMIPQSGQVNLSIYSITGELIKSLVNKNLQAGFYSINWNGENESFTQASTGVYLYKLNYAGHQWVKKMILIH